MASRHRLPHGAARLVRRIGCGRQWPCGGRCTASGAFTAARCICSRCSMDARADRWRVAMRQHADARLARERGFAWMRSRDGWLDRGAGRHRGFDTRKVGWMRVRLHATTGRRMDLAAPRPCRGRTSIADRSRCRGRRALDRHRTTGRSRSGSRRRRSGPVHARASSTAHTATRTRRPAARGVAVTWHRLTPRRRNARSRRATPPWSRTR